jgi:hypothetical protein
MSLCFLFRIYPHRDEEEKIDPQECLRHLKDKAYNACGQCPYEESVVKAIGTDSLILFRSKKGPQNEIKKIIPREEK